jgi:hypothetical protein
VKALGLILIAPLAYVLLTGYLFAKVRPVPLSVFTPFELDNERQLDRIAA